MGKSTGLPFTSIWATVKDDIGQVQSVLAPHSSDFTLQSKAICDQRFMSKDHLAQNTLCTGREANFKCIMDEIQCPLSLENWQLWRKISQLLKAVCLLVFLRSSQILPCHGWLWIEISGHDMDRKRDKHNSNRKQGQRHLMRTKN